jgi:hypothetical protein
VTDQDSHFVPAGVRAIAGLFAASGVYLALAGALMLMRTGAIGMAAGAPLLFGLELAGPYMFLLTGVVAMGIALGLLKLNNLVRHAAILSAIAGVVMLVPSVSSAVVSLHVAAIASSGLGVVIRVLLAWYLSQAHVVDSFRR